MKVFLAITLLLFSTLLFAQAGDTGPVNAADEDQQPHRRKTRIRDLQFDRVDYFYKDNLLQYSVQHNAGGGFPRTWRYIYEKEGADAIINRLRTKYPQKSFHGATQVAFRNRTNYEIIMEDKRRWYIYQTDTLGTITLKKKFRKR